MDGIENRLKGQKHRAESFRLLSGCYRLPDSDLAGLLQTLHETVSSICGEASGYVAKMKDAMEKTANATPISIDYARLFVGPFQLLAAPYGSVYLEEAKTIMGDSTLDVRARYREAGLDVAYDFNDPPDHIAAELEFIYFLMLKEMEASWGQNPEAALDWDRKRRDFLRTHPGAWVPAFADLVEEKAGTDFYRNLARATRCIIQHAVAECSGRECP